MFSMVEIIKGMNDYNYFLLRDFDTIETINNCSDVDMYVEKKDFKKVHQYLTDLGFVLQKTVPCKYPHYQYKKISDKIYRFDIVTDFVYGINKYNINFELTKIKKSSILNSFEVKIPNSSLFLYTMLLHILFDKNIFSEKNYSLLLKNIDDETLSNIENNVIKNILIDIKKNSLDMCNENINDYKNEIIQAHIVKKFPFKLYFDFVLFSKRINNKLYLCLKKNNIAFIGLDGTGKSTVVSNISNILGTDCEVVYMGLKDFKYKFCKENESLSNLGFFGKVKFYVLLYLDFFGRYYKYRYSKKIVIFDRYVYDFIASANGGVSIFNKILYSTFFPKPKLVFYLKCPADISLKRKDDIDNVEKFIKYKQSYDEYVDKHKKIIQIDTNINNNNEVLNIIINKLNKL